MWVVTWSEKVRVKGRMFLQKWEEQFVSESRARGLYGRLTRKRTVEAQAISERIVYEVLRRKRNGKWTLLKAYKNQDAMLRGYARARRGTHPVEARVR